MVTKPGILLRNVNILVLSVIEVIWGVNTYVLETKLKLSSYRNCGGLNCAHQVTEGLGENEVADLLGCFIQHFHKGRQN